MNETTPEPRETEYRCPGETLPISRAVHLGRLAAFYPACRECPHRHDTGSLSPRQKKQLAETATSAKPRPLFHDEGAGGVFLADFFPRDARRLAAAFCVYIVESGEWRVERKEETTPSSLSEPRTPNPEPLPYSPQFPAPSPCVILAGDGRPISAELVAAAAEGIRFSGCDVIDIGPATSACLAFAIAKKQATGGMLIGNPGCAPHEVGMQFWTSRPSPLSVGAGLEALAELTAVEQSRPTRRAGGMSRFPAADLYLSAVAEHYHALRPLRVVVDSASRPLLDWLRRLTGTVACEIIPLRDQAGNLADQILADSAHFGVVIDGDGETCRVFDEQGREAEPEKVVRLLTKCICVEPTLAPLMETRAQVSLAMQKSESALGFCPDSRYWHMLAGIPVPDALLTVTWLLKILSRDDEPLSRVLDREV